MCVCVCVCVIDAYHRIVICKLVLQAIVIEYAPNLVV